MKVIDDYIAETYNLDINGDYEVVELDARKLINGNRLDIMAKLLYIESSEHNTTYGKQIYIEHLGAMTKHSFVEAGNLYKDSPKRFIEVFDKTIFSIRKDGFCKSKLPVPIDLNNQILDGAHRVAAAIYFNKKIKVVKLPIKARDKYNYKFFEDMAIDDKYIGEMVQKYIERKQDIFVVNIRSFVVDKIDEMESLINEYGGIVYYKEISLNEKDLLRVYVIDGCFNTDMVELKEKICSLFGIVKQCIYITDTIKQAIEMVELLFNDNSMNFFNGEDVPKCKKSYKLFLNEKLKEIKKLFVSLSRARRKTIVKIQGLIIRFIHLTGIYKSAKQIYIKIRKRRN